MHTVVSLTAMEGAVIWQAAWMGHEHTTTAADGTTIAWSRLGSGDPVVLVHGITESAASWEPLIERLSATNDVISLDLRGHGESGTADAYDLAAMVGDIAAVVGAAEVDRPHLVGHSLGGAVVSAAGPALQPASVTSIDQSLQLGEFKAQVVAAEPILRDPDAYGLAVDAMFEELAGTQLSDAEKARVNSLRRARQEVLLGAWAALLEEPQAAVEATVDAVLSGYRDVDVPYLAVFGIDPGDGYADWLRSYTPAEYELWEGAGHYPHLVDPDRFVDRLRRFWSGG
ncbi:MAG: alpha/beta hydrolase [Actinomycetota bacterium]